MLSPITKSSQSLSVNTKRPRVFLPKDVLLSLRESAALYGWKSLPELEHLSLLNLGKRTTQLTEMVIANGGRGILTLGGLPGSGKSKKSDTLQGEVYHSFGGGPIEHVKPVYPDGHEGVARTFLFEKDGVPHGLTGIIHTDESFNYLGEDRRGRLLSDSENFLSGWGREYGPRDHLRYMLTGNPTDRRLYLGTDIEKKKNNPGGLLQVVDEYKDTDFSGIPSIFIVEGVDATRHLDKLKDVYLSINRKKIEVLQILFDISPEFSLVKVLGRDHDMKGYGFYDSLRHRVLENYYIMKEFIVPAYTTPGMILLDPKKRVPEFTRNECQEILAAIERLQEEIERNPKLVGKMKKRDFMLTLLSRTKIIIEVINDIAEFQERKVLYRSNRTQGDEERAIVSSE